MNLDKIKRALAIGEKYAAVRREVFISMPRICAIHNKPYAAIYTSLPDGRYRFKECLPVVNGPAGKSEIQTIDFSQIEIDWANQEKCLWCGCTLVTPCGNCNQFVCYGRVKGNLFKCCDACGYEAVMSGTYSSFTGSKSSSDAALKAPAGRTALQAPGSGYLRLTSGK